MNMERSQKDQAKQTQKILDKLNKSFGGKILRGDEPGKFDSEVIPCPSPGLSDAVNYWGIPKGKITQFYGPEGCLDSETFINYKILDENGKIINKKGGTIERLYERFHQLDSPGRGKNRPLSKNVKFTTSSVNEENCIFHNGIEDVIKTGQKECFKLTSASGKEIVATSEHKFWTGERFVKTSDLSIGSTVYVHSNVRNTKETVKKMQRRVELMVKFHPNGRKKIVNCEKTGKAYTYFRIRRSRAVVEAQMNGLTLAEYLAVLDQTNPTDRRPVNYLPESLHVHHIDEDCTNDHISNLCILDPKLHNREHAIASHNNLRFVSVEDEIVSIESVGIRNTYDIRMKSPYNNYIANGFVVHNCGKTFMAMLEVLEAQKMDPLSHQLWLDCEFSFSMDWAEKLGIDISRLIYVQENNGAEVFAIFCGEPGNPGILDMVIDKEINVNLVVLDSIASIIPPVEEGRKFSDQNMAALARFLPMAFRVAASKLAQANVAMICINQAREAIGTFNGGLTYPGGRTYRHMCSLNVLFNTSLAKAATLYDKDGKKVGHKVNCIVEKTRGGVNRGKTELWLNFNEGVANIGEDIAMLGAGYGIVERPNNVMWLYSGHEVKGKDNFFALLDEDLDLQNQLISEIKAMKMNGGKIVESNISDLANNEPTEQSEVGEE